MESHPRPNAARGWGNPATAKPDTDVTALASTISLILMNWVVQRSEPRAVARRALDFFLLPAFSR